MFDTVPVSTPPTEEPLPNQAAEAAPEPVPSAEPPALTPGDYPPAWWAELQALAAEPAPGATKTRLIGRWTIPGLGGQWVRRGLVALAVIVSLCIVAGSVAWAGHARAQAAAPVLTATEAPTKAAQIAAKPSPTPAHPTPIPTAAPQAAAPTPAPVVYLVWVPKGFGTYLYGQIDDRATAFLPNGTQISAIGDIQAAVGITWTLVTTADEQGWVNQSAVWAVPGKAVLRVVANPEGAYLRKEPWGTILALLQVGTPVYFEATTTVDGMDWTVVSLLDGTQGYIATKKLQAFER